MKYGWPVHSLTDFSKSGSCCCEGSRVSVTICCAGSDTATAGRPTPTRNFLMKDSVALADDHIDRLLLGAGDPKRSRGRQQAVEDGGIEPFVGVEIGGGDAIVAGRKVADGVAPVAIRPDGGDAA